MWWDCAKHIKKTKWRIILNGVTLINGYDTTWADPCVAHRIFPTERPREIWHSPEFPNSKTAQIKSFVFSLVRFVKYSLWCLIYCADEEALHEKWHFFVVDFCVDFFGTINSHTIPLFFLFSRCQLLLCMSKKETIWSIAFIFWIEFWHLNLNWLDRKWKTLIHAIIHNFCRFRLTRCSGLFFGP